LRFSTLGNVQIKNRALPLVLLCVIAVVLIGFDARAAKPDPGTRLLVDEDNGPARLSLYGAAPEIEIPGEGISVGVRARYITIPDSLFDVYLQDHTSFHSYTVGIEVGIDGPAGSRILFGLDYSDFSMPGGNFRQIDENPDEASYTEINLHVITVEALFLWKYAFVQQFGVIYGAGLGVSYTPGDITSTDVTPNCTEPVSECAHWNTVTSRKQPMPSRFWPMITVIGGFYIDPTPGIRIRLEGGFRGVVFAGLSARSTF
jgi:hypothetical protein